LFFVFSTYFAELTSLIVGFVRDELSARKQLSMRKTLLRYSRSYASEIIFL